MFPTGSITISNEISASTSPATILPVSGKITILYDTLHASTSGQNPEMACDGNMINMAHSAGAFPLFSNYVCNSAVSIVSQNNSGQVFYSITYLPYDITQFSSNTFPSTFFTGGDFFLGLEMLILILFSLITMVWVGVRSVAIHKKYTGVNEIEGKSEYNI